jgi:hypothetical protein
VRSLKSGVARSIRSLLRKFYPSATAGGCVALLFRALKAPTAIAMGSVVFGSFAFSQVAVATFHEDSARTGQNLQEAILTPANVNPSSFGKLCSYSLGTNSYAYAQPLYVPNVSIDGIVRNVVYIATETDTVYAFDADCDPSKTTALWSRRLGTPPTPTDLPYADFLGPNIGITGTPVIDLPSKTLYVVAKVKDVNGNPADQLHALDITTGAEKFGGPVEITATVAGNGTNSSGGSVTFDARTANQRAGLLFVNGMVYIAWGSFTDTGPYHGWVMAYDGTTLQQLGTFNATPNGGNSSCTPYAAHTGCDGKGGGIWTNGAITADQNGTIFAGVGNGTFDSSRDYGESFIKLQPRTLTLLDSFTPFNVSTLNGNDLDLGGGTVLLPDQPGSSPHLLVSAGKEGRIYLINRDFMGGHGSMDNVVWESGMEAVGAPGCSGSASDGCNRTSAAFWNNWVYFHGKDEAIKAFQLNATNPPSLSATPVSKGTINYFNPNNSNTRGATPIISSNGNSNGIAWDLRVDDAADPGLDAILYAYDARNLANKLWSSDQNSGAEFHYSHRCKWKGLCCRAQSGEHLWTSGVQESAAACNSVGCESHWSSTYSDGFYLRII